MRPPMFGPDGVVAGSRWPSVVCAVLIVAAACTAVGYRTRPASVAVFGSLVWLYRANPAAMNYGDAVLRHMAFFVMLSPAGADLSVDRHRSRGNDGAPPVVAAWSLRLMQLQLAAIYLASAVAKLEGARWRDGEAVTTILRVPAVRRVILPDALLDAPLLAHALTWGTIGIELAIPVLIWSRRLRPWVAAVGVCFHLMIAALMQVGFFPWAMLLMYLPFVPPERMTAIIRGTRYSRRAAVAG